MARKPIGHRVVNSTLIAHQNEYAHTYNKSTWLHVSVTARSIPSVDSISEFTSAQSFLIKETTIFGRQGRVCPRRWCGSLRSSNPALHLLYTFPDPRQTQDFGADPRWSRHTWVDNTNTRPIMGLTHPSWVLSVGLAGKANRELLTTAVATLWSSLARMT